MLWSSGILLFFLDGGPFEFSFHYLLPTLFLTPPGAVLTLARFDCASDRVRGRNLVELNGPSSQSAVSMFIRILRLLRVGGRNAKTGG